MRHNEFLQFITRFSEQAVPATIHRHVYLWLGEADDLLSKSPAAFIRTLDLHQLCRKLEKTPYGEKAAGRELLNAIETWLLREFPRDQRQKALLVTGLDLLYRYRLPLSTFMQLASENRVVILAVSAQDVTCHPIEALPSYIQFSSNAILNYVESGLPEEAIVGE